ncbi:hypothetical protein ABIB24_004995 [Pseudomonas sp. UYEF17]
MFKHKLLGLLRSPSRHKAAPTQSRARLQAEFAAYQVSC